MSFYFYRIGKQKRRFKKCLYDHRKLFYLIEAKFLQSISCYVVTWDQKYSSTSTFDCTVAAFVFPGSVTEAEVQLFPVQNSAFLI